MCKVWNPTNKTNLYEDRVPATIKRMKKVFIMFFYKMVLGNIKCSLGEPGKVIVLEGI